MQSGDDSKNSLGFYWMKNLVGTSTIFSINLLVTITAGLFYSFKVFHSPVILAIFGVVSPVLFTFCLYDVLLHNKNIFEEGLIPRTFLSTTWNRILMMFDISITTVLAYLIFVDILNNFFFRFIQTLFIPVLLLLFLRIIFLTNQAKNPDQKIDKDFLNNH